MNPSRSRSGSSGEEISFQENERRWQQERLHREEAYYQFINELNDEDYQLMRDHNLLGTPGEITSEELQQRLERAKEQLASQPGSESGTSDGNPEALGEHSDEGSLLQRISTFPHIGNMTRSRQNRNQSWRAVSRTNPNRDEFGFSLEIPRNPDNRGSEVHGEDSTYIPLSAVSREHRQQRPSSPVARRTRSQTFVSSSGSSAPGGRRGARRRHGTVQGSLSALGRLRSGIGAAHGAPRVSAPRTEVSNTHTSQSEGSAVRQSGRRRFGAAHIWENASRSNNTVRNTNQRLEPTRLRPALSSRSRSPIQRQNGNPTVHHNSQRQGRPRQQMGRNRSVRHRGVTRGFLEQGRGRRGTDYTPLSNLFLVSRITVEAESSRSSAATQRHPAITLDMQVRRTGPGETRDRDSIANRTRSRAGLAERTVESNRGGFHRTISHLERSGVRTYVSTITVPLGRISEHEVVDPSSVALRSISRQSMTGFGELSSLTEVEPASENQSNIQHLPEVDLELSNGDAADDSAQYGGPSSQASQAQEDSAEMLDVSEPSLPQARPSGNRSRVYYLRADNSVDPGGLPLARFYLVSESDDDDEDDDGPVRGLTREQIDNLSTRSYEQNGVDSELANVCTVCISDYVAGNKLRQLPCLHEFHIHCIDRWLSKNCTCPICRRPVLESGATNSA